MVNNVILKSKDSAMGKAALWFTICNILQRGIQFLVTPIYTRLLMPEGYGRYSTFLTWCNLLAVIATLSLSSGIFNKAMTKFDKDRDKYVISMLGLSLVSTILSIIIYFCIYNFISNAIGLSIEESILMFFCVYFQMVIQLWAARRRYEFKYRGVIVTTLIFAIIIPVLGITFFNTIFHSEMGLILGYTIANVLVGLVLFADIGTQLKYLYNKVYWKYALSFNLPLIPHYLSNILLGQSDRLMISYYCGDYYTGIYTLAYQISLIMSIISNGVENALIPWLYEGIKQNKWQAINKKINGLMLLATIPFVFIMLIAPEFVVIMGSADYREAIYVIPPVVTSSYLMFINIFLVSILFYYEKNINVMLGTITGALVNIVLNVVLLQKNGYIIAAYTTILGYLVIYVVNFFTVRSKLWMIGRQIYSLKKIIFCITIMILSCFVSNYLYKFNFLFRRLIIGIIFIYMFRHKDKILKYIRSI